MTRIIASRSDETQSDEGAIRDRSWRVAVQLHERGRLSRDYSTKRKLAVAENRGCSGVFLQGSSRFGVLQIVRGPPAPNFAHRMMFRGFRENHPGAVERLFDTGAHILGSDVLLKLGLTHESRRLFSDSAENKFSSRFLDPIRQALQSLEAGRINRGHVAQS